jgi:endonuclease/exonuclease/phosphatase family metal-dependent hydrolase
MAGNGPVRFVNTHLEQSARDLDPTNPLASIFQSMQAVELISILAGFPNPLNVPIIVVGDINSSPQDQTVTVGPYVIVPPYLQFAGAGYTDAWTLRPGDPIGFTCCQDENLLNLYSNLYERVDVTFTSELPVGMVKVNTVGNDEADKTPSGLWPSDHAGVVTRLEFAP